MYQILTRRGEQKKLAKIIGCSRKTVNEALLYKTNTALAAKIRKAALERGGMMIEYQS